MPSTTIGLGFAAATVLAGAAMSPALAQGYDFNAASSTARTDSLLGDYDYSIRYLGAFDTAKPGETYDPGVFIKFKPRVPLGEVWSAQFSVGSLSTDGPDFMPFYLNVPTQGTSGSNGGLQIDVFNFNTLTGGSVMQFDLLNGKVHMGSTKSYYNANGVYAYQMVTPASGTPYFKPLPYLNSAGEFEIESAVYNPGYAAMNTFGVSANDTWLLQGTQPDGYFHYLLTNSTVAGDYHRSFQRFSVTGTLIDTVKNTAVGGAIDYRTITSGGQIANSYSNGSSAWTFGLNTSGNFVLAASGLLSGPPAIMVSSVTLQTSFYGPIQLASYAAANLPSAATVGAGALVWLSDGSGQIAISDGAGWTTVSSAALGGTVNPMIFGAPVAVAVEEPVATQPLATNVTLQLTDAESRDEADDATTPVRTAIRDDEDQPTERSTSQTAAALAPMADPVSSQIQALTGDVERATGGVAAAMALGGTLVPPDTTFSVSFNVSTFAGERGYSGSAVGRISKNVWLSGGIAGSTVKKTTGGRAGVTFGW